MRRTIFFLALIAVVGIGVWFFFVKKKNDDDSGSKIQPIAVSRHSPEFIESFRQMMNIYYDMTEGFVNWDSTIVNQKTSELKIAMEGLMLKDLGKDTLIYETALSYWDKAKTEIDNMNNEKLLDEKRVVLNKLTPAIYDLLHTVHYDQAKVYLQECPMAFKDEISGFWLSSTDAVRNPYLGTSHPRYGKAMLECGQAVDSLNYKTFASDK